VGHAFLVKQAEGTEDGSYLVIIEFASEDDYDNVSNALDEVSTSLFRRPYTEITAEEYAPLRDVIEREVYLSPPAGM
jgi:hypothetical protein